MGRKKIENKNVSVSISLPAVMVEMLEARTDFNLSKFCQIHLGEYLQTQKFLEETNGED